jgi:hypothetical protein
VYSGQGAGYAQWRDQRLSRWPVDPAALTVPLPGPDAGADALAAMRDNCDRFGFSLYACDGGLESAQLHELGRRLGLRRLVTNPLAEDDGISRLTVSSGKAGRGFIPYTDRRLRWHTDGYYRPHGEPIQAFLLHCVRPAASGGENQLMDPQIAWILLQERDPALVRALAAPDVMTIPARGRLAGQGTVTVPVFQYTAGGQLVMRYTRRSHNIQWKADATTRRALEALEELLDADSRWRLRLRLLPGQGMVANNVLHDRSAFQDDPAAPRVVLRARYLDRVKA